MNLSPWEGFLDVAAELAAADPADEAKLRSAVSRAYYAAFHAACVYVGSEKLSGNGNDHVTVWELVREGGRRQERAAATYGSRLRAERKWADYTATSKPRLRELAQDAVEHGRRVLASLRDVGPR